MFTGIVEELGEVAHLTDAGGDSAVIGVRGSVVTSDARHGDSIAVNGVCLTVIDNIDGVFTADVMGETLRRSSLGVLRPGSAVNLERAATVGSRLGGHLVQGHVDGVGEVVGCEPEGEGRRVVVEVPAALARFVAEKGSIALDGVSLTVAAARGNRCEVALIPHTLAVTTAGAWAVGRRVNIEVDLLARYVARLMDEAGIEGRSV